MDKNSVKFLNQIAGFNIRIKELHWNAKTTAEHELCDKITDTLRDMQDKTAEELQTLYGKIKPGDTQPIIPKAVTTKSFLAELLTAVQEYYKYSETEEKFVGIKANLESYISDINTYDYLSDMAVTNEAQAGRKILVTKKQVEKAIGNQLLENINHTANDDVTGVYQMAGVSVYINESNSFMSVKDKNKNIVFEHQGPNMHSLLNLLKAQGKVSESKGGFKTILNEWLRSQKII